ncbi:hypothetical protein DRP04_15910 [Archaeoglobales archaeon]|nr:MAG: hypothetical protein DRP04_15910 [Archaeoglobales archaeon]
MPSLEEVIQQLEAGFYVVPEIQRPFVWRNTQVCDLVASIYGNDPIGGMVYWEIPSSVISDENLMDLFRPLADDLPIKNGRYMIIDGQQRLTSLLLVKRGEISTGGKKRRIKLYFNPVDEVFELGSRRIQRDPLWFNVTEVINSTNVYELIENQIQKFGDDSLRGNPKVIENLSRLHNAFKTYEVYLIPAKLKYMDDFLSTFERISRIFVNLNSRGTRIRMPDLALALLTARVRKDLGEPFRKKFENILKKTEEMNYYIDEAVLIRLYSAISTGTTRFNDARKELEKKSGREIDNFLTETEKSIKEAVRILQDLGIKSARFLQSRYMLVPIAYLLYREVISKGVIISDEMKNEIIKWLILASQEKRYTGKLETDLLSDVEKINQGKGIKGLIEDLRIRELPLSVLDEDYENRHLTLLLLLYHKIGTRDWNLREIPNIRKISEIVPSELHVHHIFPKEFLERRGYEEKWDHFGNITIISREANEAIKFKDPREYLSKLKNTSPELLEKHFIPLDEELWSVDNYERFLEERIKLIAKVIEKEFGIKVLRTEL